MKRKRGVNVFEDIELGTLAQAQNMRLEEASAPGLGLYIPTTAPAHAELPYMHSFAPANSAVRSVHWEEARDMTIADLFGSSKGLQLLEDKCMCTQLPEGAMGKVYIPPEELLVEDEQLRSSIRKRLAERWFGIHEVKGTAGFWTMPQRCLSSAGTGGFVFVACLVVQRVLDTDRVDCKMRILGCTHASDLKLALAAKFVPQGSRAKEHRDEVAPLSYYCLPCRPFGLESCSFVRLFDSIHDWGDDWQAAAELRKKMPDYDDLDADAQGQSRPPPIRTGRVAVDDYGDSTFGGDDLVSTDKERQDVEQRVRADISTHGTRRQGYFLHCKNLWRTMSPDQRRHGWYYIPAPAPPGRRLTLMDETCMQHIDELKLRMSKRMFLLFTLGHFLNDPTHKGNTHKLFGQAHMFVSVNNFVTDRYMTDLIFATVCHRPDWCQRVADAEGALAMLYFLWLDHIEERELMYRANSIMAQEYGGMTIAEYYARLCGRASDYSRGDISLLVASRIFEYARDNTLQRCARWAELMDVDPKTRVARVHDQLQEGDLGKHVELLMECGYKIGKDLGSAWTVDGFEDIAAAAAAAEGSDDDEGQVARPDEGSTSMSAT